MKTCIHNLYHITMSVYVYDVHSWSSAGEFPIPISLSALLPSQVGKEALPLAQEFVAEQGTLGSGQMDLMAWLINLKGDLIRKRDFIGIDWDLLFTKNGDVLGILAGKRGLQWVSCSYAWDNESCHLLFSHMNWGMNIHEHQVSWSRNQGTRVCTRSHTCQHYERMEDKIHGMRKWK